MCFWRVNVMKGRFEVRYIGTLGENYSYALVYKGPLKLDTTLTTDNSMPCSSVLANARDVKQPEYTTHMNQEDLAKMGEAVANIGLRNLSANQKFTEISDLVAASLAKGLELVAKHYKIPIPKPA